MMRGGGLAGFEIGSFMGGSNGNGGDDNGGIA
jgi:hypothetical protein